MFENLIFMITLIIFIVMQVCAFINIDGKLKIYFIDVGQGDSMLVKTVNGKNILIDGGEYTWLIHCLE